MRVKLNKLIYKIHLPVLIKPQLTGCLKDPFLSSALTDKPVKICQPHHSELVMPNNTVKISDLLECCLLNVFAKWENKVAWKA